MWKKLIKEMTLWFICVAITLGALALLLGYVMGKVEQSDQQSAQQYLQLKREVFRDSVYRANDRWCVQHPHFCKA